MNGVKAAERKNIGKFIASLVFLSKSQFLPTLRDIENEDVKKLARRLKGKSEKETFTNILEWQDRNVKYWAERGILEAQWLFLAILIIILYFIVFSPILILLHYYLVSTKLLSASTSQILVLTVFLAFLIWLLLQNALIKIMYVLLFSYPIYQLEKIYLLSSVKNSIVPNVVLFLASLNGVLFGAAILSLAYLVMSYNPIFRGIPLKARILKILRIMNDTFQFSLPVAKVLDYHMAICKDYAKFTATLLFILYPNAEVYFITIPRHVAASVKINGKYYVLDQKLPILTMNGWLRRWNRKSADVYVARLISNSGKIIDIEFRKNGKVLISDYPEKPVNTEKLTKEIVKMLKINQISQKEKPDFETPLKNYATYYEDDEIVIHSLARAIKSKLESWLCSNIGKVSKVEISQNGKDLIVKVYIDEIKQIKNV